MSEHTSTPAVRASDSERETAIERLRVAAGEGRLTLTELAERIEGAAGADTRAKLERLTADLPGIQRYDGREHDPERATTASGRASVPRRASVMFADVRRGGSWTVPREGKWESFFGDVRLDLRTAHVTTAQMRIDAGTVFGNIEVLIPAGVEVEIRSHVVFGDLRQEAGEAVGPNAPRITLTGGSVFGSPVSPVRTSRTRAARRSSAVTQTSRTGQLMRQL
jgi:hypothetical protein